MKNVRLVGAIAFLCVPVLSHAVDGVSPGYGANYKAKFVIDKNLLDKDIVVKTDDVLTAATANDNETVKVPLNKSMGWNDTATNPDIPACSATVTTNCLDIVKDIDKAFGWGHSSHWYLVDLSQFAGKKVHVHIKAERYSDGAVTETATDAKTGAVTTLPSDDDLIPGVTVWKGYQNAGTHLHWFPNKHQTSIKGFWGGSSKYVTQSTSGLGKLSLPTWDAGKNKDPYKLNGTNSAALGYDSAYNTAAQTTAEVSGIIMLSKKDASENYLTIAVGGDGRHASATLKHDVNYKLTVSIHSAK
jgi:hypothetical protein